MFHNRSNRLARLSLLVAMIVHGHVHTSTAAEFIPLGILPGSTKSWAAAVSDDGRVVAGESGQIFRWTDATGILGVGFLAGDDTSELGSEIAGLSPMSADGSVIVGHSRHQGSPDRAFIWRDGQGIEKLAFDDLYNFGVSADGNVIVGMLDDVNGFKSSTIRWSLDDGDLSVVGTFPPIENPAWTNGDFTSPEGISSTDASYIVGTGNRIEARPNGEAWGPRRQFIWSVESGLEQLELDGFASNETYGDLYEVERISADGAIMAGNGLFEGDTVHRAFRWSEETGAISLGWLSVPGEPNVQAQTTLADITEDGSVVIGNSRGTDPPRGYVWSDLYGIEDLQDVLADRFALEAELDGWSLAAPADISPNGQFIVGTGLNPDGNIEGWLVRLDHPFLAVPEPSSSVLLMCACSVVIGRFRRRTTSRAKA